MTGNMNSKKLENCGCAPICKDLPINDKEYVRVKKTHLDEIIKQLVLHSNKNLVNIKPCYGKEFATIGCVSSALSSHSKILKRLKTNIDKSASHKKTTFMRCRNKPVSADQYYNCFNNLITSFQGVLSTFYEPTDIIPIQIFLTSLNSSRLTLSLLEHLVTHNGNSIRENEQAKPEDRSSQLESITQPPI